MRNYSGFLSLLAAALIFSTFGVFIRELDKMFGNNAQVFVRAGVAFIYLAVLVGINRNSLKIPKGKRWYTVLFSLSFPIAVVLFTASATRTKAANSVFMLYAVSLAVAFLIGTFLFKEKVTWQKITAQLIVVIGLIIFIDPRNLEVINAGILLGLASGVFDGLANSLRRHLGDLSRNVLLLYQYGTGATLGLILAIGTGENMVKEWHWSAVIVALVFGIGLVMIGKLTIYGFNHFDVNIGTIILATELFFALVVNYIFLSESPTNNELLGGVLIFAAASLASLDLSKLRIFKPLQQEVV